MSYDALSEKQRLFMAIGEVIVQFQFIENVVADILANLLQMKSSQDSHRIAAAMSFRQKIDLLCDLYPTRKNAQWPHVEIDIARKSLFVAEQFRNSIVHSFWHLDGKWMRTKASLKGSSGLNISTGEANIERIEIGAKMLYIIRDWYLGDSNALNDAIAELQTSILALNKSA